MCTVRECGELDLETTTALVGEARAGCERAIELLYRRYFPRLSRWAKGRLPASARDLVDTVDVVQDALIRTIKNLDSFESRHSGAFLGYVRKAVKNRIEDQRRRASRKPAGAEDLAEIPDPGPSPMEEMVGREILDLYEEALERLEPNEQDLLIARLELGMSFKEIAREFGRPSEDAARMAVRRATLHLVDEMKGGESVRRA